MKKKEILFFLIASYCSLMFCGELQRRCGPGATRIVDMLLFRIHKLSRFSVFFKMLHIHRAHFEPLTIDIARRGEGFSKMCSRTFQREPSLMQRESLTDHNLHNSSITMCALVFCLIEWAFSSCRSISLSLSFSPFVPCAPFLSSEKNKAHKFSVSLIVVVYFFSIKFLSDFSIVFIIPSTSLWTRDLREEIRFSA